MNKELLLDMISVALIASLISSQVIQKFKETINLGTKFNKIISMIISFGVGFCYAISFYTASILYAIWIGLFTLIGAEGLYKTFKRYFGLASTTNKIN